MSAFPNDISGQVFGLLTTLRYFGKSHWFCVCKCGRETVVLAGHLRSGHTSSCGCKRKMPWNKGKRGFQKAWNKGLGMWSEEEREEISKRNARHGHASKKYPEWWATYLTWHGMTQRCCGKHPDYGGRGIKVCERWLGEDGFKNFLADMGERPSGRTRGGKRGLYTIDRINPNGNYEPDNCRWATYSENLKNRR